MVKNSVELRKQAEELLAKARQLEEQELFRIGKIALTFYKKGKIKDVELKQAIDDFYADNVGKKRGRKRKNEFLASVVMPAEENGNIFRNNAY